MVTLFCFICLFICEKEGRDTPTKLGRHSKISIHSFIFKVFGKPRFVVEENFRGKRNQPFLLCKRCDLVGGGWWHGGRRRKSRIPGVNWVSSSFPQPLLFFSHTQKEETRKSISTMTNTFFSSAVLCCSCSPLLVAYWSPNFRPFISRTLGCFLFHKFRILLMHAKTRTMPMYFVLLYFVSAINLLN